MGSSETVIEVFFVILVTDIKETKVKIAHQTKSNIVSIEIS